MQAADGDLALSLGLVLGSTLLSPLSTPASLHTLGMLAPSHYGEQLHQLAGRDTGTFLFAWVLIPSALGVIGRAMLPESRVQPIERRLRIVAPSTLLVLCYANASSCLPTALGNPDWDFLGIVMVFVVGLCTLNFAAGHVIGRLLRRKPGPEGGAHVRTGDEQQRHGPGFGIDGAGLAAAGHAADHRLQPGPAPDRRQRQRLAPASRADVSVQAERDTVT